MTWWVAWTLDSFVIHTVRIDGATEVMQSAFGLPHVPMLVGYKPKRANEVGRKPWVLPVSSA